MALNDELITITDVRGYKAVSINMDDDDFVSYLKRTQDTILKGLLGDALWYDFFLNISDAKYQTLLDGEAYTYSGDTVYFPGLKPFLCYSWLVLYITEGNINHTVVGNFNYDPATALGLQQPEKRQGTGSYKTDQSRERNNIIQYLNEKYTTYTLWNGKNKANPTQTIIDII